MVRLNYLISTNAQAIVNETKDIAKQSKSVLFDDDDEIDEDTY